MALPKTILFATDFSPSAKLAQRQAVELAQKLGARLYVLHVWRLPQMNIESGWVITEDVYSQIELAARTALLEAVTEARGTLPSAEEKLVQGDPRDCIVDIAKQLKADMIVLGTHGRRGLSRAFLGSVAEYIVRHGPCAVLVVRETE